ncbi:MAG: SNF2-related protein [Shewanella sp.]
MLNRSMLHEYQERCVQFIKDTPKCALWIDLGMGKSISSLTALSDLNASFDIHKALIIAPLRVANTTWHKELKAWAHTRHLTYSICTGSEKERRAALWADADVYIINRENVKWLVDLYGKKWPFDMVVIDEASSFKSTSAQRWKALRKVLPYIDRLVELTATPASNGLMDLYAQTYLLDCGERLGRNMTAFKSRFFESDYMGYKFNPKEGAKEKIYGLLDDLCMTMKAEDYLQLPDRIDLVETVTLPSKVLAEYKVLEKEFIAEVNGEELSAVNAATLANKLLQVANGAAYTDDLGNWHGLHDGKLDALAEIIEQNPGENILVAYNYKSDLERITERFPQAVVLDKKGELVHEWNAGKIPLMLAHPASAGHGLNLQHGGSVIVWFGLNWSLELYQQFNGRLHRQGQTKPVRVIHIVSDETIDRRVMLAIESKAATQDELLNFLKITG